MHCFNLEFGTLKRKSSEGNPVYEEDDLSYPQRTLTVSLTCVMDTVNQLRALRSRHEYLVQCLVNTLAAVMSAVRSSNQSDPDPEPEPNSSAHNITEQDNNSSILSPATVRESIFVRPSSLKLEYPLTSGELSPLHNVGKVGSPFRENYLDATHSKGELRKLRSFSAKLEKDFQFHLSDAPPGCRRSAGKSASEDGCLRQLSSSADSSSSHSDGIVSAENDGQNVDDLRLIGQADIQGGAGVVSSALLRENMEAHSFALSILQQKIRMSAEQDNLVEMYSLITQRTGLADKAAKEVNKIMRKLS